MGRGFRNFGGTVFAATTLLVATAANAEEITVMGYRGAFQENYVKAVVEPFEKANPDIKVVYYGVQNAANSLGNLRAQKNAPQTDVVIFDLSVAKIATDEKLLAEVTQTAVPNLAHLAQTGRELGGFALPVTYDTLVLLYNHEAWPTAPTSWEALWDDRHRGNIVVPAQGGGDIQAILLTIIANRLAGNDDYVTTVQPGVEKLIKMAPLIQTWEPRPDAYTLVANKTATTGIGWNARSQYYYDQTDGAVRSLAPREGTAVQVNVISAVANTPRMAAAERFINYALSAEAQGNFANRMFYAPTNTTAAVDAAAQARIPYMDPQARASLIPVNWIKVGEIRGRILEPWRRQIIPASR